MNKHKHESYRKESTNILLTSLLASFVRGHVSGSCPDKLASTLLLGELIGASRDARKVRHDGIAYTIDVPIGHSREQGKAQHLL